MGLLFSDHDDGHVEEGLPPGKFSTIDKAAVAVLKHQGVCRIWYGSYGLCEDVYSVYARDKAGKKAIHPLNKIATVLNAVSRSSNFRKTGYIKHLGRNYPVFELL